MDDSDLQVNRKTTDIDANWVDEYNEEKIIKIIKKAVKKVDDKYSIELYRLPEKMFLWE